LVRDYGVPVSRACKMASIPRSQYYYQSTKDDSEIVALLQDLSGQHPTYGFKSIKDGAWTL
jgi:putative transposase